MKYPKYLKSAFTSFLVCWLIFLLAAIYQIGFPTAESAWINDLYIVKTSFAHSIKSPKLVILSGSSALFGISSQMITQDTGIPTVNYGMHAGLGTDYLLYKARNVLNPGDTVLFPLEYGLYTLEKARGNSNVLVDYIVARDPKYLLLHPWIIGQLSFNRVFLGISAKVLNQKTETLLNSQEALKNYDSRTINVSGDETYNLESNINTLTLKKLNEEKPFRIKEDFSLDLSKSSINEFVIWCRSNKIKLLATWPNTLWFDVYNQPQYQSFFKSIAQFYQDRGVPILGKYRDFMYSKSMFYDTAYHLHDRGRTQHTKKLIALLKPYLQDMTTQPG